MKNQRLRVCFWPR